MSIVKDLLHSESDGSLSFGNHELPAKEIVKRNPELKIVDDDFFTDEYAIAVKKGNTELLNSINNTIRTIKANGIYQKMLEAYMPLDGDVKIVTPEEL